MSRSHTFRPFAALLAILALGFASHAVAQTPARIMPLGDSITAAPGCWRAYLWTQLQTAGFTNIDFVGTSTDRSGCGFAFDEEHEGHSGFSITGIADQNLLPNWLTAANPSIVIVHLGTNDMWGHFIALQTKLTASTKLIGQMRTHNPGMKIIVAQIIPMDPTSCTTCNADVIEFNNALPAWAAGLTTAQSPITLVNQFTGFDVGADTFDRVHPVDSGFRKMADEILPGCDGGAQRHAAGPDPDSHALRRRHGHCRVESRGHQLRHGVCGELPKRHIRHVDRSSRRRLDIRGLERRLHGNRRLHRVDDTGAFGHRHLQHRHPDQLSRWP